MREFIPLLARFHARLEESARVRDIGKGRKERYVFTRRTLIEFLEHCEVAELVSRASGKERETRTIQNAPKEIIQRALAYYYLDKVRSADPSKPDKLHDDYKKVRDILDAVGISDAHWVFDKKPTAPPEARAAGRKSNAGI